MRTNTQSGPQSMNNQQQNNAPYSQELSSTKPNHILQLQKRFGNQSVIQMIKQMNSRKQTNVLQRIETKSPEATNTSDTAPMQMKWDWEDDHLMGWDDVSDGIHWYYDSESQLMSFLIVDKSPTYMAFLARYEGKPRPYEEWVELWRANDWNDGLPAEEEGGPVPIFGTDFPKEKDPHSLDPDAMIEKSPEKKIAILIGALKAGYRIFDTAELYGNAAELIFEAAKQLDIPPSEIEIIYKVEPEDPMTKGSNRARGQGIDERISNMKSRLRYQMHQIPLTAQRVVMLHEMPEDPKTIYAYLEALNDEMSAGETGAIIGLGVSNVSLAQLEAIYDFTMDNQLMRLRFVQNRFSPYNLNTSIVDFCGSYGITFMGYGLRGGAGLGACKQGYAMPQEQLQFLQDERFLAVADEFGVDPNQLMIAYAKATGVSLVMYSEGHAGDNYDALKINLNSKAVAKIDALFLYDEETTESEFSEDDGVGILYQFVKDPTTWYILDTLMEDGKILALIKLAVDQIVLSEEDSEAGVQKIKNFVHRLVRFVTHMQVLKQSKLVKDWRTAMQEIFSGLIGQIDAVPDLAQRVVDWSQSDYLEIGGALHSMEEVAKLGMPDEVEDEHVDEPIVDGAPKVADHLILKPDISSMMTEDCSDMISDYTTLAVDTIYYCFYAPDGITARGPKYKLFVTIIGPKDGGVEAVVSSKA